MVRVINGYRLITPFTNNNAGMCQWAFAQKNGCDYFIKQFLSPKYPTATAEKKLSPAIVNAMRSEADAFYSQRKMFYDKLFECRTGNVVVVQEFFREEESFYIVTEKMKGPFLTIDQISSLSDDSKRTLFKAILYSIIQIHDRGIVHSDLKPDNIMVKQTVSGFCTAKLIDFDSGYFAYDIPEEIIGDQQFFSPEAILRNAGRAVPIGVKSDVFALGLLFHLYWCGSFPSFDYLEYDSASIALLNHSDLSLNPSIPIDIRSLISRMLAKYQDNRPSARTAWEFLSDKDSENPHIPEHDSDEPVLINTFYRPDTVGKPESGFRVPDEDDL